jgi:stage II sporulation protein E
LVEGRSLVGDYVKNITRMMDRFIDEYSTSEGKGRPESPPALRVVSGIARLPKRGGHISGDSFLSNTLSPDRYLMVLSDGMGVGKLASVESKQCVNLVHQMIEAGFTPEVAVQTANSALLLRSPEDTFATVDVALCDLATGRAEFVKIGAAPSFMKRGTDVTLVKMSSVPIGIINQVQIEPEYRNLRPGDLLIMITDGIWDVSKNASDKERWLINHLTRDSATDPEEVAESILARAMELMPEVGDDMTVLVARFDPLVGGKAVAEAKRLEPTTWASVKRAPRPGDSQPSTRAK